MFTVGLTGGIGSGKTTVCRVFSVLGIPVFNSDEQAKLLLQDDPVVKAAVVQLFGRSVYPAGKLDRKALAQLVFNDPKALAGLNAIVHPAVRRAFQEWAESQQAPYVINEAAILVETGAYRSFDRLITVEAPEDVRLARVMARDGSPEEQVRQRMANQATEAQRREVAYAVIENDGHSMVLPQVLALHEKFNQEAQEA
ncbi:MAG: dephospho-CoA kinase [Flavobacteriales bacterium]|jgi:dephospho-CoA kinase|nr:dephospho-CoA kinase [Flavobacteriales bacterium]